MSQINNKKLNVRYLAVTGMLAAIAFVIMFFDFPVPMLIPNFIEMDFSELPALIGAFAFGPLCGVLVSLMKNLVHLTITHTAGVGELANFLMGAVFAGTAGLIYKHKKNKRSALIGSLVGALLMGLASIPINYFITYPFYYNFMEPEAVLMQYQLILPSMENILECLVVFNFPFTTAKALICAVITMLIYKHLSPILKGRH